MPYTRFVKRKGNVDVYKKEGGKEVKAFTSKGPSLQAAHRTAAIREMAKKGKLRIKAKSKKSLGT